MNSFGLTFILLLCTSAWLSQVQGAKYCLHLDDGTCVSKCPTGTFPDKQTLLCVDCLDNCDVCHDTFSCKTCTKGYIYSNGACRFVVTKENSLFDAADFSSTGGSLRQGLRNSTSNSTSTGAGTSAPVTAAPSTMAPSTAAPSTAAPSTMAPSTAAPSTMAPSTAAPSTMAPSTAAPSTKAPSTAAPSTMAPSTAGPSTAAPSTAAPSTAAPGTMAPTMAPSMGPSDAPATSAPTPPPVVVATAVATVQISANVDPTNAAAVTSFGNSITAGMAASTGCANQAADQPLPAGVTCSIQGSIAVGSKKRSANFVYTATIQQQVPAGTAPSAVSTGVTNTITAAVNNPQSPIAQTLTSSGATVSAPIVSQATVPTLPPTQPPTAAPTAAPATSAPTMAPATVAPTHAANATHAPNATQATTGHKVSSATFVQISFATLLVTVAALL